MRIAIIAAIKTPAVIKFPIKNPFQKGGGFLPFIEGQTFK